MKKIESLQVLRALAALSVFAFHIRTYYSATGGSEIVLMGWGFMGVDVFFVLSGFVVAYTSFQTEGTQESIWFLIRRASRVYLGYWPFLFAGIILVHYVNPAKLTSQSIWTSFFLTAPDMFLLIVGIAWTLVFELFFYGLFAFLICLKKEWRIYLLAFLALLVLSWNCYWQIRFPELVQVGAMPVKFFFSGLVLEFLTGSLLAYGYLRIGALSTRNALLLIAGLAALVAALMSLAIGDPRVRSHELFRAIYLGGSSAALIFIFLTLENQFSVKFPQFLVRLGDASYSLYLLHGFALDFVSLSGLAHALSLHPQVTPYFWILYVSAVALVSYCYYALFERKVYKAFISWLSRFRRPQVFEGTVSI